MPVTTGMAVYTIPKYAVTMPAEPTSRIPALRLTTANSHAVRSDGRYVLYWMTASRRTTWNFALQRAVEWATQLKRPLVVFEPLRCGYRWACDRFHAFVLQGMADNAAACAAAKVTYLPYVEDAPGNGHGLLEQLASEACVVIGDDYPAFFLPHMIAAAAKKLTVRFEVVDSNGLLPLRSRVRRHMRSAASCRRVCARTSMPCRWRNHSPLRHVCPNQNYRTAGAAAGAQRNQVCSLVPPQHWPNCQSTMRWAWSVCMGAQAPLKNS
jgi:hypothetical protein